MKIYAPLYMQIYQREGTQWFFHGGDIFYNARGIPTDLQSTLERNGLTKIKVLVELFRLNGGKPGYYLANIRDKKYYYCGHEWGDIRRQLRELGIGRDDPIRD